MAINFKDGVILGPFSKRIPAEIGQQANRFGLQVRTVEPQPEHISPTESRTSLHKFMIQSGVVGQGLRRIHKQLLILFNTNLASTASSMVENQPHKQRQQCSRSSATRTRID